MQKIKIGIPRTLLYYRYGVLWKHFFQKLGCKIILSPETNNEILELGIKSTKTNYCLPYKIYIGHAIYLNDKTDYILVINVRNYGRKNDVCPKLNEMLTDIERLISRKKILYYTIDYTHLAYEFFGLFKIGLKLTKNPLKIIYSYIFAKKKQKQYDITKENEEKNKLINKNKKILIVSQFYNINDKYISNNITEYLKKENITILYSNYLDKQLSSSFSEYFVDTLSLKYTKEMIGSLYYYLHQVDGIILISTSNCEIDAIVNNLVVIKNKQIPILNVIINETNNNIDNSLNKFINIVKGEHDE